MAAFDPDREIHLERNPYFRVWSRDARPDGYPGEIRFHLTDDEAQRLAAVERGDADADAELPLGQLGRLATRYPGRLDSEPVPATDYMFLNTRVPPFDSGCVGR